MTMSIQIHEIITLMKRVFTWQLANLPGYWVTPQGEAHSIQDMGWIRGTFFIGAMAAYNATEDDDYLEAVSNWAENNHWQPGPRTRHADDHCVGQVYAELYLLKDDPRILKPVRETFDQLIDDPTSGREEWWWCDALFMAPPVLARLSFATGERKYIDFMNKLWWDTTELLYDKENHLFFRDRSYKIKADGSGPREANGHKILWARGNGWVIAGLVRILQFMPEDYPDRARYVRLLKEMIESIVVSQSPSDGLWRASLLDPGSYPSPETSSSGLFCYALAWGINEEIFDKEKYLPSVEHAWDGLLRSVSEEGKLGWVQLPGDQPSLVTKENTMEYGAGAFLLAGSEVIRLLS
jgi:unsaturated rhamnogalacturonyl hydrolase